jgi:hypothetical protein
VNKNPKESGSLYLPERYRQQIEAKKKRRLVKKIAVIGGVIAVVAVVYLVVSGIPGFLNQSPPLLPVSSLLSHENASKSATGEPATFQSGNISLSEAPNLSIGAGVPLQPTLDMLSLDNATRFLRLDYPASAYSLISVNITGRYKDRIMYEFRIRQTGSGQDDAGYSVFIDAGTGDPYTLGQDSAKISADRAKTIIKEAFPMLHPDTIRVRYDNHPDSFPAWIFSLTTDNMTVLTGTLEPETGQVSSFSLVTPWEDRQAEPLLDISVAQNIADRYILEKNRVPLPLNMSEARYIPLKVSQKTVAGHYVFVYNRIVQGIPCDSDGFTISIDSVNGEVTGYERRWNSPDSAFSVAVDSLITRYEATFSILQRARETHPESVDSLSIVSAEIRWKDQTVAGLFPRPGSIPMAWKVQFTDKIIQAKQGTALGWVDVQTGEILDFSYPH